MRETQEGCPAPLESSIFRTYKSSENGVSGAKRTFRHADAPKIGAGWDIHDFWRERIGKAGDDFFHGYGSGGGAAGGHSAGGGRRTVARRGSRHGDGGESDAGALHFAAAAAGIRSDAEKCVAGAEGGSSGTAGAFEGAEGAEVPDAGAGAAGGDPPAGDRCVDRGAGGGCAGHSYAHRSAGYRRRRCDRRVHHHGGDLRCGGTDVRGGNAQKPHAIS